MVRKRIALLQKPAGRSPPGALRDGSVWYNNLSERDAAQVNDVIRFAANAALIGLLSVLDGARKVDDQNGRFELLYLGNEQTLLNPPSVDLHDLFDT